LQPQSSVKFLGVFADQKLNFNKHIDCLISKCKTRLFLMRKLKLIGLNVEGLKLFYTTNIHSIMCYAIPAFYTFLSEYNKSRLEIVQKAALRVFLPEFDYEERCLALELTNLNDFMFKMCANHFINILRNDSHPLYNRIIFNTNKRVSSRIAYKFRPRRSRTTQRQCSFFNYFMNFYNNFMYN
jgi:hypothetical protein